MIKMCVTCANYKQGCCYRLSALSIRVDAEFICDFYRQKTSGAFRRKMAKLNKGDDVIFIIGTRGAGKRYVMEGKTNDK